MSTFRGKISVSHDGHGYAVKFDAGTQADAHDLGHALAAVMTMYRDEAKRGGCPQRQLDTMHDTVLEGIRCGLDNNPQPLATH